MSNKVRTFFLDYNTDFYNLEDKCDDFLFVYIGSFNKSDKMVNNEDNENFYYNKYKCLKCGKVLRIPYWRKFENARNVYKVYSNHPNIIYNKLKLDYELNPSNYKDVDSSFISIYSSDKYNNNKVLTKKLTN